MHEAKLVKMQEDMETMLARKVAETEQKTLDYEDQVCPRAHPHPHPHARLGHA